MMINLRIHNLKRFFFQRIYVLQSILKIKLVREYLKYLVTTTSTLCSFDQNLGLPKTPECRETIFYI